jgi:uncharacterized membrane protein YidH (DUF202 family)
MIEHIIDGVVGTSVGLSLFVFRDNILLYIDKLQREKKGIGLNKHERLFVIVFVIISGIIALMISANDFYRAFTAIR